MLRCLLLVTLYGLGSGEIQVCVTSGCLQESRFVLAHGLHRGHEVVIGSLI